VHADGDFGVTGPALGESGKIKEPVNQEELKDLRPFFKCFKFQFKRRFNLMVCSALAERKAIRL
jgi:hypothetical protein